MTTQKTLTRAEARKALCEGLEVRHESFGEGVRLYQDPDGSIWIDRDTLTDEAFDLNDASKDGWSVYEEPHQNPTLEECLKAKRVGIVWPERVAVDVRPDTYSALNEGWLVWVVERIACALSLPGAVVKILEA
jgi:hypothetical protein